MKGTPNRIRYRRRAYRASRVPLILLIVTMVTLLALVIGFLIVGNRLNDQNEERDREEGASDPLPEAPSTEREPLGDIQAPQTLLETADASTLADRLAALSAVGRSAASVPLNTAEGRLLYRTELGVSLGFETEGSPTVELSGAMRQADEAGVYISGVYRLTVFDTEDELLRSVELSRAAALLAEAVRSGMDEVLLLAPDMTADHIPEVLRFAESIRQLAPDAVVGLTLSGAILSDGSAAELIDTLWNGMDFLAMNAADHGETEPAAHITAVITDPAMRYNILRYRMRILIPAAADPALSDALVAAVEAETVYNWQMIS